MAYDEISGGLIDGGELFEYVHTPYWDAVGNPVLVAPMGFNATGLPLSLQIGGRPFDEASPLCVGDAFQHVTDWHRQVPAMVANTVAA